MTTIICWFDEEIILPRNQPAQASLPTFLLKCTNIILLYVSEVEWEYSPVGYRARACLQSRRHQQAGRPTPHIPGLVTSDNTIKEVPCGSTQPRGHTRSKDFAGRDPLSYLYNHGYILFLRGGSSGMLLVICSLHAILRRECVQRQISFFDEGSTRGGGVTGNNTCAPGKR